MPLEIEHLPDCPDRDVTHMCECLQQFFVKMGVEAEALRRIISDQCDEVIRLNKRLNAAKDAERHGQV